MAGSVRSHRSRRSDPAVRDDHQGMNRTGRQSRRTDGQLLAVRELRRIAGNHPGILKVVRDLGVDDEGHVHVLVRLTTNELDRVADGLPISPTSEEITVRVSPSFPLVPPEAYVDHDRFVGHPHVLQGHRLCVYLDSSREWHPRYGIQEFMNRLWDWFADAAAGRFDSSAALFHPVGGVLHRTPGTPTIVIRKALPVSGRAFLHASLAARTASRIDLSGWNLRSGAGQVALVIVLDAPLSYGAGTTVSTMLERIAATGRLDQDGLATLLAHTAARNKTGTPLYALIAVPHPGRPGAYHLIGGRLPVSLADALRAAACRAGPLLKIAANKIPGDTIMEWCKIADERPETTTRRDSNRPIARFAGKTVEIWGCGGLGSWIAEFVARAGATRIVVRDHGDVGGGLLVRQNYIEADVGDNKAERLAERLRQISDELAVESYPVPAPAGLDSLLPPCDLLIDATITNSVGTYLDLAVLQNNGKSRPVLAQVATDTGTGTLGLLTVCSPDCPVGPEEVDRRAGLAVTKDGRLERFHVLWREPGAGEELIPAPGCSIPTYRGSAADLAGVAASLVSLMASHLDAGVSGTHLVALPHAPGSGPSHHFIPASGVD